MKKLLIILMLSATVANVQNDQATGNEGAVRVSESRGVVPADYRKTTLPFTMEPAVITAEYKGVFIAGLGSDANVAPQIDDLKERMMNDKGIMSVISAMQNDPEMQALLSDPAIMSAIQSGDIATLISNPAFMKFLDNPRVREIEKSLETGGTR